MSADRLMRTARWIESFDGGIAKLRDIILNDSLGICADLERYMDEYVGSYFDEWAEALKDPVKVAKFRQFANTDETSYNAEQIEERGQMRPADWPKEVRQPRACSCPDLPRSSQAWCSRRRTSRRQNRRGNGARCARWPLSRRRRPVQPAWPSSVRRLGQAR